MASCEYLLSRKYSTDPARRRIVNPAPVGGNRCDIFLCTTYLYHCSSQHGLIIIIIIIIVIITIIIIMIIIIIIIIIVVVVVMIMMIIIIIIRVEGYTAGVKGLGFRVDGRIHIRQGGGLGIRV